jgi:NTE family protein
MVRWPERVWRDVMANPVGANPRSLIEPVDPEPSGADAKAPEDGMALCLSGGGSRALLFHTGALWRLNELGLLPRVKRISSVSGGSIAAAVLAAHWSEIGFGADGVGVSFGEAYVARIRRFANVTIDRKVLLKGILLRGSTAQALAGSLAHELFEDRTLQDLPADDDAGHPAPRFVINASNLQSTAVFRFSRPYAGDYRIGRIQKPTFRLADAVAASCAFPPFFGPLALDLTRHTVAPDEGSDLNKAPYTTRALLVDGGVYDNLGLETIYKRYRTLLVSNGGGHTEPEPEPDTDWPRQTIRVMKLLDGQVRSLRARMLMHAYEVKERSGAYWGMRTDVNGYGVRGALSCPHEKTLALAALATRLAAVPALTQEHLINWGYAVTDAAIRQRVLPKAKPPKGFPYPEAGVG